MSKSKFRNQRTYKPGKGFITDPVSMTVPGRSMTIQEMIARHQGKLLDQVQKVAYYDQEEDFDRDLFTHKPDYDLTDIDEMKIKIDKAKSVAKKLKKDKPDKTTASAKPDQAQPGQVNETTDGGTTKGGEGTSQAGPVKVSS